MSTYVLMKILESTPYRYDKGIAILTLGRLDTVYDRLTSYIQGGHNVLDLGCGTGALTVKAAQRGAVVKGIDVNPDMLAIAQRKADELNLTVEFVEMGVAELSKEEPNQYDVIMSGLCFSELTEDELLYTLKEVHRILKPEGLLLIADEVIPESVPKRILSWVVRAPLVLITYIVAQTITKSVRNLPETVEQFGFTVESVRLNRMENFMELVGRKEEGIT